MKIFYAVRLFSGLEESVRTKIWQPTGVPTIYKVIEAIDKGNYSPILVFVCKDNYIAIPYNKSSKLSVRGLNNPIHIIINYGKRSKFHRYINEIIQTFYLMRLTFYTKPDVCYFSNANFIAAALVSRFTKLPVVLRLMGVYPPEHMIFERQSVYAKIARWAYRSPFALVLCTQDGSGGELWLTRALHPNTRRLLLINGVSEPAKLPEMDQELSRLPENATIVTHIGKLEYEKGVVEFIDGFLRARDRVSGSIHALVIGVGSLDRLLRRKVEDAGAKEDVTFIDRLSHEQIPWVHSLTDVFVSLNRLGNLSNVALEAMRAGCCMVIPEAQPETGVDSATDRLVPPEAAMRIPFIGQVKALADALQYLHYNPDYRKDLGIKNARNAALFIPSWKERVDQEITALERLMTSQKVKISHQAAKTAN